MRRRMTIILKVLAYATVRLHAKCQKYFCRYTLSASGKSIVIARICSDAVLQWGGRVLILAHVKELLQQNTDKLHRLAPDVKFGIYSAGLKSRLVVG